MIAGKPMLYVSGHNGRPATPRYIVDESTGCWVWQWCKNRKGYGRVRVDGNARSVSAHRYYYEKLVGPIPDGMEIDHLCKNPSCVNPRHLEPVTMLTNIRRGRVCKINLEIARQIKADLQTLKIREVMAKHGVSNGIVSSIKRGATWKDA